MRIINKVERHHVHGGKSLSEADLSNAYMMAGSMIVPGIGLAVLNHTLPTIANMPLWGGVVSSMVVGIGTGIGVCLGYQLFYAFYDIND